MSVGYVAVYQTSGGSPSRQSDADGATPTPSADAHPEPDADRRGSCTTTATADISADCYSAPRVHLA